YHGTSVVDFTDPNNPIYNSATEPQFINDLVISGNYEYAVANGLAIYDLSNRTAPQLIGSLSNYRSLGVTVGGTYAYVSAFTNYMGEIQVIDISRPAGPRWLGGFVGLGLTNGVAVSSNIVYAAAGDNGFKILRISSQSTQILNFDLPAQLSI